MLPDRLVMMANQIGKFFVYQGSEDEAVAGIADHIKKFWDPRMRLAAFELLHDEASADGAALDELPRRALTRLAEQHALTSTRYTEIGTARTEPDVGDVTEA